MTFIIQFEWSCFVILLFLSFLRLSEFLRVITRESWRQIPFPNFSAAASRRAQALETIRCSMWHLTAVTGIGFSSAFRCANYH